MINCERFYNALREKGINFFSGVPDSLLKDFNAYIMDNAEKDNHIIAANEGGAIALATGHYLSTGKIGLVYMQNSGIGNAVNPLMSLADREVYSIPMILMIGWRGEPGVKDEPQHKKQGRVTPDLLKAMEIDFEVLPQDEVEAFKSLERIVQSAKTRSAPSAIVVREGTFEKYSLKNKLKTDYELNREGAMQVVLGYLNEKDIVVSTTGKLSRELYEERERKAEGFEKDFLTVGSMGHSSQIGLGIALEKKDRNVYCFDGDGAAIMHLGSLAIIGSKKPSNFRHIVFNNGAHDSVGGQPTVGFEVDFVKIAEGCGYRNALRAATREEIKNKMEIIKNSEGPILLEIRVNKGAREDLGRPKRTTAENKKDFMNNLGVVI